MTRRMLVVCKNGDPFETEIEDDERLRITDDGHIKVIPTEGDPSITELESPAEVIYELIEVDRA